MFGSTVVVIFSSLLIIVATFLFGHGFIPDESYKGPVPERGYLLNKRHKLMENSPAYRALNKLLLIFAYWFQKLPIPGVRKALGDRLGRAGHLGGFTADEYLSFCVVSSFACSDAFHLSACIAPSAIFTNLSLSRVPSTSIN